MPRLYPRNPDLDPQLVLRGKDEQDAQPLSVDTVPTYIQEKIHPKVIIEGLRSAAARGAEPQADLFADFNGVDDPEAKLEFYAHDQNWSNRMILGDALLVMNSLAEKEALKCRVQMIYLDPHYGIRFASNWQPSTRERDAKDGKVESFSRDPEVVKAFRDTWRDVANSYLTYVRDRVVVARGLLIDTGSIFVQIGGDNGPLIRLLLEEVLGVENVCSLIAFRTTTGAGSFSWGTTILPAVCTDVVWYARKRARVK